MNEREAIAKRIDAVLADVRAELFRAWDKHGMTPFHSAHEGHSVIREELEVELWSHVCNDTAKTAAGRKEAVQVGAMAVRFVLDVCDAPMTKVEQKAVARTQGGDQFGGFERGGLPGPFDHDPAPGG